jgi:hypothetical protein
MQILSNNEAPSCTEYFQGKKRSYILRACVCSLRFPANNAHASYRHLWSVQFYLIFLHHLINSTIFGQTLLGILCYFDILRHFSFKVELSDILIINVIGRHVKYLLCLSCQLNGYPHRPRRILYLLVVYENGYAQLKLGID